MKQLASTLLWFLSLAVVVKLLFFDQPLGYFWIAIAVLSIFFGYKSVRKIELSSNASMQLTNWVNKFQSLSYYERQGYLHEVVNNAIKRNQPKQALEFLELVIKAEPDNDTAKTLMASIWGAELIGQYADSYPGR
ncbi:hypothetical protein [Desulforamulus aquiferis]|uniref:Tetratricopeptide repeat protein n=1 Tax=Desulforamulus aquiferis TaxID=1397668 RepID=A0AAW7ZFU1_9FIRM|nr:hypothetical protein [Desulforamulus aquiferis]MDO7788054.1 hypothetical protein [Desulforamulus aquiferis]